MKGILMTAVIVAAVWFFWMTAVAVIRTGKNYSKKRKEKKEDKE